MVYSVILSKGEQYYTYLSMVFNAIENRQLEYNFLLSAIEAYPSNNEYFRFVETDDHWISGKELTDIVNDEDFQWIWGILYAFPKEYSKEEAMNSLNSDDDFKKNSDIPSNTLNYDLAEFVIIPFDSSFVIIKSRNKEIIELFKKNKPLTEDYTG